MADYSAILEENLTTISDTKAKFQSYRELVKSRARELEEEKINVRNLTREEEENLGNLRIIEGYLNRTIEEHQKILSSHFDLKSLYTRELEQLSQMALIRRFSFAASFTTSSGAGRASGAFGFVLPPSVLSGTGQVYNLNKALEYQRPSERSRRKTRQRCWISMRRHGRRSSGRKSGKN